jgi:Tol biopolymer transport system component
MLMNRISPRPPLLALCILWASAGCAPGDDPAAEEAVSALDALASGTACPAATPFSPGVITTDKDEGRVTFTPDGRTVYFHRKGDDGFLHLLVSHRQHGGWSAPTALPLANFAWDDWDPALSPDGEELYFTSRRPADPSRKDSNLWRARRTGQGWSDPELLGPEVNSLVVDGAASVAADGTLYFISNRAAGSGSFDIYLAHRAGDGFTPAENLGPVVNSAQIELHPEISPDGSVLFFTSIARPDSLGGPDLYATVRLFGQFVAPFNLGPCVNTAAAETNPTLSRRRGSLLFVRNVGQGGDILEVPLPRALLGSSDQDSRED